MTVNTRLTQHQPMLRILPRPRNCRRTHTKLLPPVLEKRAVAAARRGESCLRRARLPRPLLALLGAVLVAQAARSGAYAIHAAGGVLSRRCPRGPLRPPWGAKDHYMAGTHLALTRSRT